MALACAVEEGHDNGFLRACSVPFEGSEQEEMAKALEAPDEAVSSVKDGTFAYVRPEAPEAGGSEEPGGEEAAAAVLEKAQGQIQGGEEPAPEGQEVEDLSEENDWSRGEGFGSIGPEIGQRTVTLNSASKAFNIPGLRTAIAHFGSADLQERFNGCIPRHVCTTSQADCKDRRHDLS